MVELHTVQLFVDVELKMQETPRPHLAKMIAADLNNNVRFTQLLAQGLDQAVANCRIKSLGRKITISGGSNEHGH